MVETRSANGGAPKRPNVNSQEDAKTFNKKQKIAGRVIANKAMTAQTNGAKISKRMKRRNLYKKRVVSTDQNVAQDAAAKDNSAVLQSAAISQYKESQTRSADATVKQDSQSVTPSLDASTAVHLDKAAILASRLPSPVPLVYESPASQVSQPSSRSTSSPEPVYVSTQPPINADLRQMVRDLQQERLALKTENAQSRNDNDILRIDSFQWRDDNSQLRNDNVTIRGENTELRAENTELRKTVASTKVSSAVALRLIDDWQAVENELDKRSCGNRKAKIDQKNKLYEIAEEETSFQKLVKVTKPAPDNLDEASQRLEAAEKENLNLRQTTVVMRHMLVEKETEIVESSQRYEKTIEGKEADIVGFKELNTALEKRVEELEQLLACHKDGTHIRETVESC